MTKTEATLLIFDKCLTKKNHKFSLTEIKLILNCCNKTAQRYIDTIYKLRYKLTFFDIKVYKSGFLSTEKYLYINKK